MTGPAFLDIEDVLEIHALLAALVFLDINGYAVPDDAPALYDLTMAVADGSLSKQDVDETLRRLAHPKP